MKKPTHPIPGRTKSRMALAAREKARARWHEKNADLMPYVSPKMAEGADKLIKGYSQDDPQLARLLEHRPAEWLETVGQKIRKITVARQIQAVALGYAVWIKAAQDVDIRNAILGLVESRGRKLTPRTDLLHLVVESVITYGDTTPEGRSDARKLYNRDVQAIRYLKEQGVTPEEVKALGAQQGQGLDIWARKGKAPPREPKEGTGEAGSTPKRPADEAGSPTKTSTTEGALAEVTPSPTKLPADEAGSPRKVAVSGPPMNVIEWRKSGSDQPEATLVLSDTGQMSQVIKNFFKVLADYDQVTSEWNSQISPEQEDRDQVWQTAQATFKFIKDLRTISDDPQDIELATKIVDGMGQFLGSQPGLTSENRKHLDQLSKLGAALKAHPSEEAPTKRAP